MTTAEHAAWLTARRDLLAAEKAHTRAGDELARARRALPRVPIVADYRFADATGEARLADLFGRHGQLLVYHFMFPAEWDAGCTSCSFWADNLEGLLPHLAARDAALVMTSAAPPDRIAAYRARMGWTTPWYSELTPEFGRDMGVRFTDEARAGGAALYNFGTSGFPVNEAPGLSVFARSDDGVFLTYQSFGRGIESFNAAYALMDLLPRGRDENGRPMGWLRRRDDYRSGAGSG